MRIKKISKFALENRSKQFENFPADHTFKLAQKTKGFVEWLASLVKWQKLKLVVRIFFRNCRLLLELNKHYLFIVRVRD